MSGLRPGMEWGCGDGTHAFSQSEQSERAIPPQAYPYQFVIPMGEGIVGQTLSNEAAIKTRKT